MLFLILFVVFFLLSLFPYYYSLSCLSFLSSLFLFSILIFYSSSFDPSILIFFLSLFTYYSSLSCLSLFLLFFLLILISFHLVMLPFRLNCTYSPSLSSPFYCSHLYSFIRFHLQRFLFPFTNSPLLSLLFLVYSSLFCLPFACFFLFLHLFSSSNSVLPICLF